MSVNLIVDLHKDGARQGPGGEAETLRALEISGLMEGRGRLAVADLGCGTGAATKVLAENLAADITAIDLSEVFLASLDAWGSGRKTRGSIKTLACSMDALPFGDGSLDAIWAEGSIYNVGFGNGARYFRQFLKSGGILAASEITWLTDSRPDEIESYWHGEYSGIATADEKIKTLESAGYQVRGYFALPATCWTENYYAPLEARVADFLGRNDTDDARELVEAEKREIALYGKYGKYYGYVFYIAARI